MLTLASEFAYKSAQHCEVALEAQGHFANKSGGTSGRGRGRGKKRNRGGSMGGSRVGSGLHLDWELSLDQGQNAWEGGADVHISAISYACPRCVAEEQAALLRSRKVLPP